MLHTVDYISMEGWKARPMFLSVTVASDVVLLCTDMSAVRSRIVAQTSTVALRVKYCLDSLFTLEFFLPMECK